MIKNVKISRTRRAVATLIDLVVVGFIICLVFRIHMGLRCLLFGSSAVQAIEDFRTQLDHAPSQIFQPQDGSGGWLALPSGDVSQSKYAGYQEFLLVMPVMMLVAIWIYYFKMESSRWGGTLGKLMMGLRVVNGAGQGISSVRSTGRLIFGLLRALLIFMLILMPAALVSIGLGLPTTFGDYFLTVALWSAFLLIFIRSGKGGQRLQEFCTRTRVVPRGWHLNMAQAYSTEAGSTPEISFKLIYPLLWLAVIGIPAYSMFQAGKPSASATPQSHVQTVQGVDPNAHDQQPSMKETLANAGCYVGICTNDTVGMTANMIFFLYGETNGTLHGKIALYGDLVGGGDFYGSKVGNHVNFTTGMAEEQMVIKWEGTILAGEISGTYSVQVDHPAADPALRQQAGTWSCRFVRALGEPRAEEDDSVWVYQDGMEEGPYAQAAFVDRLMANEWKTNALVGLNDRTTWSTAQSCIEQVRAKMSAQN